MSTKDLDRVSTDKRIAAKSIRRSRLSWPGGRLEATSTGGSSSAGHVWSGSDGHAVPMAGSAGSRLVIFVPPAARSHELSLSICPLPAGPQRGCPHDKGGRILWAIAVAVVGLWVLIWWIIVALERIAPYGIVFGD
jgi:hypothetical protein